MIKLDGSYWLRCSWNSEKNESGAVVERRICKAFVMIDKNPARGNKIKGVVVECLLLSDSIGQIFIQHLFVTCYTRYWG